MEINLHEKVFGTFSSVLNKLDYNELHFELEMNKERKWKMKGKTSNITKLKFVNRKLRSVSPQMKVNFMFFNPTKEVCGLN